MAFFCINFLKSGIKVKKTKRESLTVKSRPVKGIFRV